MKTIHTAHGGKLSVSRVLRGEFKEGDIVLGSRGARRGSAACSGWSARPASARTRREEGDVLAFGRMEGIVTGDASRRAARPPRRWPRSRRRSLSSPRRSRRRIARTTCASTPRSPSSGRKIQHSSSSTWARRGTAAARPGRSASAGVAGAARQSLRRGGGTPPAASIGYRETIREQGGGARPPQEADRRPRPVRRRGASRSSPCRAARASSSWTASRAAWCRANTSPPWSMACAKR